MIHQESTTERVKLCCWCDEAATGAPIRYAGIDHPACPRHSAAGKTAILLTRTKRMLPLSAPNTQGP